MSKRIDRDEKNGFTLIEMLLVVGLMAISVGVTNDILVSLIRANTKTQVMNEIEQQSNFISLKLEKELRDAKIVTNCTGSSLEFTTRDGVDVTYTIGSNRLERTEGASTYILTSDSSPGGVKVLGAFTLNDGPPQVVGISLTFTQAQAGPNPTYKGSSTIETSVVIRNTY